MSITYLPNTGSITEKGLADLFAGALPMPGVWRNGKFKATDPGPLSSAGLVLFLNYDATIEMSVSIEGYSIIVSDDSDLAVTLPANSIVYVYLVLDMAGGGINTVGQRLVYYTSKRYIPHSLLLARVYTDATGVMTDGIVYLANTRPSNALAYPSDYGAATSAYNLSANTEQSTTSTTAVLVKQFQLEYAGVYRFEIDLKRSTGTATAYVYCASTGLVTPQLTYTGTTTSYVESIGELYCVEGDAVYVYLKSSNTSYTAYADNCSVEAFIGTPMAPALVIE